MIMMMFEKFVFLFCTLAVIQRLTAAIVVEAELHDMSVQVTEQTVKVTQDAVNENPNTLTEEAKISQIIGQHVDSFDYALDEELTTLLRIIETGRKQTGVNSARGLCLTVQETKLHSVRGQGEDRAKVVQADVDKRVDDLVSNTRDLIAEINLDLQVKTIVQLCTKLYTNIGLDKARLRCFDEYGAHLTTEQKSRGEGLVQRVGAMQQQSLRISQRTDGLLRHMYAQNELAYSQLNTEVQKCMELPDTYFYRKL